MTTAGDEKTAGSKAQVVAWAVFILVGWAVFAYLLLAAPGGLPAAWAWVRTLPFVVQLIMWLLFLPWMLALWISQTSWATPVRVLLIGGLALATFWISIPPLARTLGGRR